MIDHDLTDEEIERRQLLVAQQLVDARRRIIRCDGTTELVDKPMTVAEIEKRIGADVTDTVRLRHLRAGVIVMFVDDRGHDKNLPVNFVATALYWANCVPGTTHLILGDVVITNDSDFGGL